MTIEAKPKRKRATKAEMQARRAAQARAIASGATSTNRFFYPALKEERDRMLAARAVQPIVPATIVRNSSMTKPYTGAELRPFDGRPGAMDAYCLPSRGIE